MNKKLFGLVEVATSFVLVAQPPPRTPRAQAATSAPSLYAESGVIRSLNYGPGGEVNGFVFANGVLALIPPMGTNDISVVRVGSRIAVSGSAHSSPSGNRTVVEVESITANGKTITMNRGPRRGPDDEPTAGPADRPRDPRSKPPPPPPAGGHAPRSTVGRTPPPPPDSDAPPPPPAADRGPNPPPRPGTAPPLER